MKSIDDPSLFNLSELAADLTTSFEKIWQEIGELDERAPISTTTARSGWLAPVSWFTSGRSASSVFVRRREAAT